MKAEEIKIALKKNREVNVELSNKRKELINFAVGDAELDKIDAIWKKGQSVRVTALRDAISKVLLLVAAPPAP